MRSPADELAVAKQTAADAVQLAHESTMLAARFERALEDIVRLDRSKPYGYGEVRPSDRLSPPAGRRWNTPRERAEIELRATASAPATVGEGRSDG